jgi:SAM-dependent methyltransferase
MKICQQCHARFDSPNWSCDGCGWRAGRRESIAVITGSDDVHGFSGEFFAHLAPAEERHFWFRSRNALITWMLRHEFPHARTFLEAGCGTAQVSAAIGRAHPALRMTGSEAFAEGLLVAQTKAPGIELVQADIRALPWEREFDVAGAFDVLEHVEDHKRAACELYRVVKPGGGVLITVPQHQWLWSPIDDYSGHERRYSRGELRALLESAGFRVGRMTSFVSLLLPVLLMSRRRRRAQPVDPTAELRLSPWSNAVGSAAMGVEQLLIRAGLSLPAGSSLLAVARR